MTQIPAGWYPDGSGATRWWDGTGWTEHIAPTAAPSPERVPEPVPATTTRSSRRREPEPTGLRQPWLVAVAGVVAVVLVLAVAGGALVALTRSDDGDVAGSVPTASSTPTPVIGPPLTGMQLDQALLTIADLPAGYAVDPSADEATESAPLASSTGDCSGLDRFGEDPPGDVGTSASFVKSPLGPYLFEGLSSGPYAPAKQQFDELRRSLATCTAYTEIEDGSVIQTTVAPLSMPKYGDDSLAFRLASTQDGSTFTVDFVVVLRGSTVMALGAGGLAGADAGVIEQLAPKALTKLDAVAAGAASREV